MQEEYTGELLDDGHLSIPKGIVSKLKLAKGSKLRVIVEVEKNRMKENILAFAGLLSDLTNEDEQRFEDSVKRRSLFGDRKTEV